MYKTKPPTHWQRNENKPFRTLKMYIENLRVRIIPQTQTYIARYINYVCVVQGIKASTPRTEDLELKNTSERYKCGPYRSCFEDYLRLKQFLSPGKSRRCCLSVTHLRFNYTDFGCSGANVKRPLCLNYKIASQVLLRPINQTVRGSSKLKAKHRTNKLAEPRLHSLDRFQKYGGIYVLQVRLQHSSLGYLFFGIPWNFAPYTILSSDDIYACGPPLSFDENTHVCVDA